MSPPFHSLYESPFTPSSYLPHGYVDAGSQISAENSYRDSSSRYPDPRQRNELVPDQYQGRDVSSYDSPYVQEEEEEEGDEDVPARKHRSNAKHDQPQSKRAAKRARITEESGSVGANNKPKGSTQERNGPMGRLLEWYDDDDKVWRLAAPHDDYRHDFIVHDNAQGSYDVAPDHGGHADDVTSFASALGQQHWKFANREWGNIVDEEGNKVLFLIEKPDREQDPPEPGRFMIHEGKILLDPDNNPVRDFPDVPRAFSSKIEGGRIEAFRRIYNMTLLDCRARMPRTIKGASGFKPLFGLTSLNQRTSRFRDQNDSPPWRPNGLKKQTKKRLRQQGLQNDEMSTEGLKPLSRLEMEKRKLSGRGKYPQKATGRAISQEERNERDRKHAKELRRLEEKDKRRRNEYSATEKLQPGQEATDSYSSRNSTPGNKRERDYSETPDEDDEVLSPFPERGRFDSISSVVSSSQASPPPAYSPGFGQYQIQQAPLIEARRSEITQAIMPDQQQVHSSNRVSEMVDLRYHDPRNVTEQLSIQTALLPTRLDFRSQNGREPPETPIGESYHSQYCRILALHEAVWRGYGSAPELVGLAVWHGSFDSVPTPTLSEEKASRILQPYSSSQISSPAHLPPSAGNGFNKGIPQFVHMSDVIGQHMNIYDDFEGDFMADILRHDIFS